MLENTQLILRTVKSWEKPENRKCKLSGMNQSVSKCQHTKDNIDDIVNTYFT